MKTNKGLLLAASALALLWAAPAAAQERIIKPVYPLQVTVSPFQLDIAGGQPHVPVELLALNSPA